MPQAWSQVQLFLTGQAANGQFLGGHTLRKTLLSDKECQRERVSLAAGANTITVPSEACAVGIILGSAVNITLKGVSGDTGILLCASSSPNELDAFLPLSGVASFVLANGDASAQDVTLFWLFKG